MTDSEPSRMPSMSARDDADMIGEFLQSFRLRWRIAAATAGAVLFLVAAWSFLQSPVYEAKATLKIGENRTSSLFTQLPTFLQSAPDPTNTEIEILKSRTNAEEVVKRLGLQMAPARPPAGLGIRISNRTISRGARRGSYTLRIDPEIGQAQVIESGRGVIATGKPGQPIVAPEFTFTVEQGREGVTVEFPFEIYPLQDVVKDLRARTTVTSKKGSSIVEGSVEAFDPVEAAETANTLFDVYLQSTSKRKAQQAFSTMDFIGKQLQTVKEDLLKSGEALSLYRSEKGIMGLSEEAKLVLEQLSAEEIEKAKCQAQRSEAEAISSVLRSPQDPVKPFVLSTAGIANPILADLAFRLTEISLQRAQFSQGYATGHAVMVGLSVQIEEAKRKLLEEVDATINSLKEREQSISGIIQRFEADLKKLPGAELGLLEHLRTSKVNESLYTVLVQKHEEARMAEVSQIGAVWVVDPAIVPDRAIRPRFLRDLAIGIFMGCFLGLAVILSRDLLHRTLDSARDLERLVGLNVFGRIPKLTVRAVSLSAEGRFLGGWDAPLPNRLLCRMEPGSMAAAAYASLRLNLLFAAPGTMGNRLLLAGPSMGAGVSLTCANLAIALAGSGKKVAVVDADLRHGVQHRLFNVDGGGGLSEVLTGKVGWRERLRESGSGGVDVLPAGPFPPNPMELLSSSRMGAILAELSAIYDAVLIDAPPILSSTEVACLTRLADGVFLVARTGKTTLDHARSAKAAIEGSGGARLLGAVLNGLPPSRGFLAAVGSGDGGPRDRDPWSMFQSLGRRHWPSFGGRFSGPKEISVAKPASIPPAPKNHDHT